VTQPTPIPPTPNAEQRKYLARVTLETRKQIQGTVVQANEERVVVSFPGSENLDQQIAQFGANEVHLVCQIGHAPGPPDISVYVFLNTPDATAAPPLARGFVSGVAFFEHHPNAGSTFRVPLTSALAEVPTADGAPTTATFVPVAFPGRTSTPQVLSVQATLDLMLSTVERTT
jgi:hypothetical protein